MLRGGGGGEGYLTPFPGGIFQSLRIESQQQQQVGLSNRDPGEYPKRISGENEKKENNECMVRIEEKKKRDACTKESPALKQTCEGP